MVTKIVPLTAVFYNNNNVLPNYLRAQNAGAEQDQYALYEIRLQFLERLLHASVVNDYRTFDNTSSTSAQPNMTWYKKALNLARYWTMEDVDEAVRAPFIYELYSAGFDRAAQEVFQTCSDNGQRAAHKILNVIGCRITFILRNRESAEMSNNLSTATRAWLRERDPSVLLQPDCTLVQCRVMLRLLRAVQTTSFTSAERAIVAELDRELSNVLD